MSGEDSALSSSERVVRVFISSTFRDMQGDREELMKQIFPGLRRMCESRGVVWGELDLRWGVTEEQKAEGKVLPICLAQIRRSRPYFIALLGERYGWVPEQIPVELLHAEPWLAKYKDRSVTELEIIHGVLADPAMAKHSFFYFRSPLFIKQLTQDQRDAFVESPTTEELQTLTPVEAQQRADMRREKLRELKQRIRASGSPVREYSDAVDLGKLVRQDLELVINTEFPEGSEPKPLDRELAAHRTYMQARRVAYVGRQSDYQELDQHVEGDGPPLVLTGASGIGKSALLANWLVQRRSRPEEFVLTHFIGATPESTDAHAMIGRLIAEISRHYSINVEIPDDVAKRRVEFANALHMATSRGRLLLVIDALNQLQDRDQGPDLVWIPSQIPSGARVVLSTVEGRSLEEIQRRGWPTFTVQPLAMGQRSQIIHDYLYSFGKSVSTERLQEIANTDACANPLYLRVLLNELRLHGEHETLAQVIQQYLTTTDATELYKMVLQRYQRDYERERSGLVRDAFTCIWASRRGLAEDELLDLLREPKNPLPQAIWSPLYLSAEEGFISAGGLIRFAHQSLSEAVAGLFLPGDQSKHDVHMQLASYFGFSAPGLRRTDEFPWQLQSAKEWEQLADALTQPDILSGLLKRSPYDLKRYWATLEAESSKRMTEAYAHVVEEPEKYSDVIPQLAYLFFDSACFSEAERLRQYQITIAKKKKDLATLTEALDGLALIRWAQGNLIEAEELRREQEQVANDAGDLAAIRNSMAAQALILAAKSEVAHALSMQQKLEELCSAAKDERGLARALGNQAAILTQMGRNEEALKLIEKMEQIARSNGDLGLLASAIGLRGNTLHELEERVAAAEAYQEEEALSRQIGKWDGVGSAMLNRAAILFERDREEEALPLAQEVEKLAHEIGWKHGELTALLNQSEIYRSLRQTQKALKKYRATEVLSREMGDGPTEVLSLLGQAWCHVRQKHYKKALEIYQKAEHMCRDRCSLDQTITFQVSLPKREALPSTSAAAFTALLVKTLYEQSECLGKMDRFGEGMKMVIEADDIAEAHGLPSIVGAARANAEQLKVFQEIIKRKQPESEPEVRTVIPEPVVPLTADKAFEAGKWKEALTRYQKAIDADECSPLVRLRLGQCLLRANETLDRATMDRVKLLIEGLRMEREEAMADELQTELISRSGTLNERKWWQFWKQ